MNNDVEILLYEKDYITPFITKKDNKYYIKHLEYTDDINLLLNAIKNIKEINFNEFYEIRHECKTMEDFFQNNLNYDWSSYSNSSFIYPVERLWHEELTRRGQIKCSKCDSTMVMRSKSCCPLCEGLIKYTYFDFDEVITFIKAKYKIEIDDDFIELVFEKCNPNYDKIFDINWKEFYDEIDEIDEFFNNKSINRIEQYKQMYKKHYGDSLTDEILKQVEEEFKKKEIDILLQKEYKKIAECFYKEFGDEDIACYHD